MIQNNLSFSSYAENVLGQYGTQNIHLQESADKFIGTYEHKDLGAYSAFKIHTNMGWSSHRRSSAPKNQENFVITLLRKGTFSIIQRGNSSHCHPGSISFLSDSAILESSYCGEVEVLAIRFPAQLIRVYYPTVDHICGTSVASDWGCPGAIRDIMLRLWTGDERLSANQANSLSSCIIRLLQGAFSPEVREPEDARMNHHLARVRQVIDEEYPNPKLSAKTIAQKLALSEGYLHEVVRSSGTTVGAMLYERRLQECRLQLMDPAMLDRSVSDIALGTGFTSLPHFSRRFKDRFGSAPRAFRETLERRMTCR